MIRRPKSNNISSERPVRRISYLRATANDISVQEPTNIVECVEKLPLEKDQWLSDELQQLIQFCKQYETFKKSFLFFLLQTFFFFFFFNNIAEVDLLKIYMKLISKENFI